MLMIAFGRHTLALSFTRNATRYSVQLLRFGYSLSDSAYFPNASSNGKSRAERLRPDRQAAHAVWTLPPGVAGSSGSCFSSNTGSELVDFKMDIKADIDKKYRCVSDVQVHEHNVTLTLQNTTLQAYLRNGSFSEAGAAGLTLGPARAGAWMGWVPAVG